MSWRFSYFLRLLALAFAVAQSAVPTVAAVADARVQAESRWTPGSGHVEEHSSESCPHRHLADCALCQFLAHGSRPAGNPGVPVASSEQVTGSTTSAAPAGAAGVATVRPRAPPSA
jgi:hypothetical protein